MSLSFNINNAGPLSRIGVELFSLNTAVQLATGAYGWWNARERSTSLVQLLSVNGGELVSTSAFDLHNYRSLRKAHDAVQGVIAENGVSRRTRLPKASTGVPAHSGSACLRALTTGLMCFYDNDATVAILQHVIPSKLLQLDQSDREVQVDGPLLASLKQWVASIATEEDSNAFRTELLEYVSSKEMYLIGPRSSSPRERIHGAHINELPLVIGMLEWMLTPEHKKDLLEYPTRSLNVWSLALVMSKLGFRVSASPKLVTDINYVSSAERVPASFGEAPSVVLVTGAYSKTDPRMMNQTAMAGEWNSKPQVTVMRAVPSMILRRLRPFISDTSIKHLISAWDTAFKYARFQVQGFDVVNTSIQVDLLDSQSNEIPELHLKILAEFDSHLYLLCSQAMREFVPESSQDLAWSPAALHEALRSLNRHGSEEYSEPVHGVSENCYLILMILLGSMYGLCSQACHDVDRVLNEDSEIACTTDILFKYKRIISWIRSLGYTLSGTFSYYMWYDFISELFLGLDCLGRDSDTERTYIQRQPHRTREFLGAQANGMSAICSVLVRPTIQSAHRAYFHIQRGQILNIPITEDGYIEASRHLEISVDLLLDSEPTVTRLSYFEQPDSADGLRLDVEPCWEADPRTVVFRARRNGILLASLNIIEILNKLTYQGVPCNDTLCGKRTTEVTVPLADRWRRVSLDQLYRERSIGISHTRASLDAGTNLAIIDASSSDAATIYAIGVLQCRVLFLATECLFCTYEQLSINVQDGYGAAIIIPWRPATQRMAATSN